MIEIRTKEQLSDFLDRYTFALKEQQDTILRIYAMTRGSHYAIDLDETTAAALAKLYIIRDGKIAFIDLYDDIAIKDITAQETSEKSDEAPY